MSRTLRRLGVFLVATSLVLPLPLLAQDHGLQRGADRATGTTLADSLALALQHLVQFFAKNGSRLDPFGSPGDAPPPPPSAPTTADALQSPNGPLASH